MIHFLLLVEVEWEVGVWLGSQDRPAAASQEDAHLGGGSDDTTGLAVSLPRPAALAARAALSTLIHRIQPTEPFWNANWSDGSGRRGRGTGPGRSQLLFSIAFLAARTSTIRPPATRFRPSRIPTPKNIRRCFSFFLCSLRMPCGVRWEERREQPAR